MDTTTLLGMRDEAILALMVTAGPRTIEVVRADVGDIRTVGDEVVLYVLGNGRDDKSEFVRLSSKAHQMILSCLNARCKKDGARQLDESAFLFASVSNNSAGGRLSTRSISRISKEALLKIGLNSSHYSAHSLRHTCACLNMINGGSLEETQQLLRHSATTTTMIYANYLDSTSSKSAQRVEDAIFA